MLWVGTQPPRVTTTQTWYSIWAYWVFPVRNTFNSVVSSSASAAFVAANQLSPIVPNLGEEIEISGRWSGPSHSQQNRKTWILFQMKVASTTKSPKKQLRRQETPNNLGVYRKAMYQIQTTVAMEQKQIRLDTIIYRNCSSRNLFWHKKQRHVYSSGPHTRTSYQDIQENFKKSSKKDFLHRILDNHYTRTCYEHPRRTCMQAPT